jgi:hypothetical protein
MDVIEDCLKCTECKFLLEQPVLLPCGDFICQKHVKLDSKEHYCSVCDRQVALPDEGLPISKALVKIINSRIKNANFHIEYGDALWSFRKLQNALEEFTHVRSDPFYYINTSLDQLQNHTDLLREEFTSRINEKADEIIETVSKYRQECAQNMGDYSAKIKELDNGVNQMRLEMDAWQRVLTNFNANDVELKKITEKCLTDCAALESKLNEFKTQSLLNKLSEMHTLVKEFSKIELISGRKFVYPHDMNSKKSSHLLFNYFLFL